MDTDIPQSDPPPPFKCNIKWQSSNLNQIFVKNGRAGRFWVKVVSTSNGTFTWGRMLASGLRTVTKPFETNIHTSNREDNTTEIELYPKWKHKEEYQQEGSALFVGGKINLNWASALTTSHNFPKGSHGLKHRKNCECCPVSLLIVR